MTGQHRNIANDLAEGLSRDCTFILDHCTGPMDLVLELHTQVTRRDQSHDTTSNRYRCPDCGAELALALTEPV